MKIKQMILLPFHWIYMAAYWVFRSIIIVIAIAVILTGIIVAIYVGVWLMVCGGIADAINLFKTSIPVDALDVAITLSKIIFGIPVGIFIALFCINIANKFDAAFSIERDEELAEAEKERRHDLGYYD